MIETIKFEKYNVPQPFEERNLSDDKMVKYGYDNLYPNFLLKLYTECSSHASIINSKSTYIIGEGLKYKNGNLINVEVNPSETLSDFIGKVVKDYLIFNCFAVEVIYNALNQPINYHFIPAQNIRTNKTKTKFWYCADYKNSKEVIVYDRWKANPDNATSKIFYFDGYFPSLSSVYPSPEYTGCTKVSRLILL